MDLLVEKLDGSRYYLSQYKVLVTDFEESAPAVARNSKQLDQRNGSIDFGGWHTEKTISVTGYYRADDIDEEENLREKLYALLSDPDGYYITQLKTTPETAVERPGETSGGYYDKLTNYPSHKRFLVYTEAPELELAGNVNGTLLYKLSVEFKTIKLPYGETPAKDVAIDSPYKGLPVNFLKDSSFESGQTPANYAWGDAKLDNRTFSVVEKPDGTYPSPMGKFMLEIGNFSTDPATSSDQYASYPITPVLIKKGETWTYSYYYATAGSAVGQASDFLLTTEGPLFELSMAQGSRETSGDQTTWHRFTKTWTADKDVTVTTLRFGFVKTYAGFGWICIDNINLKQEPTASPWSPNPADPEYYNVSVPYTGSVLCNQLEQGFTIELTALSSASSLFFKIGDTELTYNGDVAKGDVFRFSGFSYTKNGLSIVDKTNKAYFVFRPDKPNRITCNVLDKVRVIGFQNFYA